MVRGERKKEGRRFRFHCLSSKSMALFSLSLRSRSCSALSLSPESGWPAWCHRAADPSRLRREKKKEQKEREREARFGRERGEWKKKASSSFVEVDESVDLDDLPLPFSLRFDDPESVD